MSAGRWPARRAFRLTHAGRVRANVDAELRFHLEERVEELMTQGLSREQAEAEARRRFGDVERIETEVTSIDTATHRRRSWGERLHAVGRDVRLTLRGIAAHPGYAVAVVLTLALAIGMNTAIYSAVRSVLLRPLPVAGLDRLVVLRADLLNLDLTNGNLSAGETHDLAQLESAFEAVAGITGTNATLGGRGEPRRVAMAQTMGDVATVFGVRPVVGRFYGADASTPGEHRVVVLGHALWQELGGDPGIVGRTVTLNDSAYQVVGVMPADFRYPRAAALWAPYPLPPETFGPMQRGRLNMVPVARLRPGVTPERLTSELRAELARWKERFPQSAYDDPTRYRITATPIVDFLAGQLRPILFVLLGAVLFVLLIACANVASLQLVRTTGRVREIAVRSALGAGRWAIVRRFLIESLVFAVLGGALGLLLGWLALRLLALREVAQYEILRDLRLDGPVLAITALVTLLAGLAFGVAPAWRAARVDAQDVLRATGGRGTSLGGARSRFLQAAVVAQVALTLVLLLGSGVMVRSLAEQLATDPGFEGERALAVQISPPRTRYPRAERLALYDRIVERVRALPGVEAAALTSMVPFSDMLLDSSPLSIPGAPPLDSGQQRHANAVAVTPDYFRAMGIRILRGRAFTEADRGEERVAIVDEELARRFFPNQDPVGRSIDHYGFEGVTIVGVARSVHQSELGEDHHPTVYYPTAQLPYAWAAVVVRSALPTGAVTGMVRGALREIDPQLPVFDAQPMPERVARSVGARRLAVTVLGGFAALALVLALLGTYGVLSYSTSQRTRELGIRLALGAQPGAVVGMVLRSGLLLAALGLAVGVVAYLGLGRLLESVVYGVSPRDPATLAVGIGLLLAAALMACWIPARRAARVDAIVALRTE